MRSSGPFSLLTFTVHGWTVAGRYFQIWNTGFSPSPVLLTSTKHEPAMNSLQLFLFSFSKDVVVVVAPAGANQTYYTYDLASIFNLSLLCLQPHNNTTMQTL